MTIVIRSFRTPHTHSIFHTNLRRPSLLPRIHVSFTRPNSDSAALIVELEEKKKKSKLKPKGANKKINVLELKERWLGSMSCPFDVDIDLVGGSLRENGSELDWVLGVDPDVSGALAVLKPDGDGGDYCAQVFDTPHLKVVVGTRIRKRPDTRAIVQLLQSLNAPRGTTAYLEQSTPFPKDGKQGWWSGGYGYGLWMGVLVASGFSVVPVTARVWKDHFELSGKLFNKDDSRNKASLLFPTTNSLLKRKMDHGRAEALLIAAYGKGLRMHDNN
ncbi:hypothetical protein ZOSMA_401G00020 [Zostera marina]|uniref:Uncharacterized protein n=1 Tax=Zostera marina TaxID=29655 RepID=A0A0K9P3D6_ZOSMR|nr:hypothetical protein ZOSMA_401G00020 [Zostera marina]